MGMKREFQEQEENRRQKRIQHLQKAAQIKAEKENYLQQLDEKRSMKIAKKNEAWKQRANGEIRDLLAAIEAEDERVQDNLEISREAKRAAAEQVKQEIREAQERADEIDMNRDEKNQERHTQRELREVHRVDKIKT